MFHCARPLTRTVRAILMAFLAAFTFTVEAAQNTNHRFFKKQSAPKLLDPAEEVESFCGNLSHQTYDNCCDSDVGCDDQKHERQCNAQSTSIHDRCMTQLTPSRDDFN